MNLKKVMLGMFGFGVVLMSFQLLSATPLSRLYITEEIFVLDEAGTTLLRKEGQTRKLINQIEGAEFFDSGMLMESTQTFRSELGDFKPFYVYQKWEVLKNKSIKVTVKEYDKIKWVPDPRFEDKRKAPKILEGVNIIKKEEKVLKYFEPINWVSETNSDKKVVLRITPNIEDSKPLLNLSELPISSEHITLYDNLDNIWIRDFGVEGKFIGIKTHAFGAFIISFDEFEGGKEMGSAYGNKINLNVDKKLKVTLLSETPFLPFGVKAKVYGIYRKDVPKTEKYTSPIIYSGNTYKQFSW